MDFLKEALKNPKDVGAVAPSSRKLARMGTAKAQLQGARVVVELGPGGGAFTGEILDGMDEGATYLGIEINPAFVEELRKRFPGAAFRHGSAGEIGAYLAEIGHAFCDRVISGIPWSNMTAFERDEILSRVARAMAPKALFVTFAYYPFNHLPKGKDVLKSLEKHFVEVERSEIVLGNLPPAFVYVCRK